MTIGACVERLEAQEEGNHILLGHESQVPSSLLFKPHHSWLTFITLTPICHAWSTTNQINSKGHACLSYTFVSVVLFTKL